MFLAGPYAWEITHDPTPGSPTWVSLGIVEGPPIIKPTEYFEPVKGDNFGNIPQGYINQGGEVFLEMVLQEWDKARVGGLMAPFNGVTTGAIGSALAVTMPPIGAEILSIPGVIKGLRATVISGSGIHAQEGSVVSFHRAYVDPDFARSFKMGSTLRNLPLRFRIFPFLEGGVWKLYSFSAKV